MSEPIYDTKGRKLTSAELFRAMLMINLSAGFTSVCVMLAAAGGNTLTVFLNEWLSASAVTIGLVMMLASFLPLAQPLVAQIVQRVHRRKRFIIYTYSIAFGSVFAIAIVPLLGRSESALHNGFLITTISVLITTLATQIVTLVMWTWTADIVPEHRRSWFFGQGQSIANIMGALGFFISAAAIDHLGGTRNPFVMTGTFVFAGIMGIIAIYLLSRVPDMPIASVQSTNFSGFISMIIEPITNRNFLKLLFAIAVFMFSMSLTHPFTILYGRAATVGGYNPGLGASLQYWSIISVIVGIVGIFSGPFWGWLGDRLGAKFVMACGSLALSWYWLFFFTTPQNYHILLAFGMAIFGCFFPAYNIGWSTCAFHLSPRKNRAAYMATIPLAMMAGGPAAMLGGYLADKFPVFDFTLHAGIPFAYIHLLTILTTIGTCVAVGLICFISMPGHKRLRDAIPLIIDFRFLPNIIRAQILAHSSNPAMFTWALSGLNGRSAQITIKEIDDKITDAYPNVRNAALKAMSRVNPSFTPVKDSEKFLTQWLSANSIKLRDLTDAKQESSLGITVEQLCRLQPANTMDIIELYAQTDSVALRKEIAVGLANGLQNSQKFYKILTSETVVPGSYFIKLTTRLRKLTHKFPANVELAGDTINKIEEQFHATNYPAVLVNCCTLCNNTISSADYGDSIVSSVITKLRDIAVTRVEKEQAIIEMFLGLFLTMQLLEQILNHGVKSAVDVTAAPLTN